jgi:uncharacterized protein (TIGR03067 family)
MRKVFAVLLLGLFCLAPALQGGGAKSDKVKLDGTWKVKSAVDNGRELQEATDFTLIFKGTSFTIKKGDDIFIEGTIKSIPNTNPVAVDFTIKKGPEDAKDKVAQAILEVKGNTARICATKPGVDSRPTQFAAPEGSDCMLLNLEREKQ